MAPGLLQKKEILKASGRDTIYVSSISIPSGSRYKMFSVGIPLRVDLFSLTSELGEGLPSPSTFENHLSRLRFSGLLTSGDTDTEPREESSLRGESNSAKTSASLGSVQASQLEICQLRGWLMDHPARLENTLQATACCGVCAVIG